MNYVALEVEEAAKREMIDASHIYGDRPNGHAIARARQEVCWALHYEHRYSLGRVSRALRLSLPKVRYYIGAQDMLKGLDSACAEMVRRRRKTPLDRKKETGEKNDG